MLELLLVQRGMVGTYDLFDISQRSLDIARETARQFGIEDRVRLYREDIYEAKIAENAYDLVTFISSLHHMHDLDAILQRASRALKGDGSLVADEYIGPNRFDFPAEHLAFARRLFQVLDSSLKGPRSELPVPTPEGMIAADPTEAVHAAEILDAVSRVFPHVTVTPMRNTLPFIMWPGLNADALFDTPQGDALVQILIAADDALIAAGQLPNYLALIVARK
ncbi:MAG: class I SAM-dependent methyltransferase, partial [Thermomicrobiales bacterium]